MALCNWFWIGLLCIQVVQHWRDRWITQHSSLLIVRQASSGDHIPCTVRETMMSPQPTRLVLYMRSFQDSRRKYLTNCKVGWWPTRTESSWSWVSGALVGPMTVPPCPTVTYLIEDELRRKLPLHLLSHFPSGWWQGITVHSMAWVLERDSGREIL